MFIYRYRYEVKSCLLTKQSSNACNRPRMEKSYCGRTRVELNINIMFHKKKMGSIIRTIGTIIYSLLYFNSRLGLNWQKYLYSVISVIDKRLPGNTGARQAEGLYAQSRRAPQGSDQSFHGVQISQPPFLLFPLFIALFSEIGQSFYPFFWDRTSPPKIWDRTTCPNFVGSQIFGGRRLIPKKTGNDGGKVG